MLNSTSKRMIRSPYKITLTVKVVDDQSRKSDVV
jgi:hypothetical protein